MGALYAGLNFVVCTDGTIEALVVLIDDGFEGLLNRLMYIKEIRFALCLSECAGVHQLQSNLDRYTVVCRHEIPLMLDRM